MKLSDISGGIARLSGSQYWAVGRHFITIGGTVILTMSIFNAQDAGTLVEALKAGLNAVREIVVQLGVLAAAVGTVMTVVAPLFAGSSASDKNQIKSVEAIATDPNNTQTEAAKIAIVNAADSLPEVKKIVAPALATAGTGDKVVAG